MEAEKNGNFIWHLSHSLQHLSDHACASDTHICKSKIWQRSPNLVTHALKMHSLTFSQVFESATDNPAEKCTIPLKSLLRFLLDKFRIVFLLQFRKSFWFRKSPYLFEYVLWFKMSVRDLQARIEELEEELEAERAARTKVKQHLSSINYIKL